MMFSRGSVGLIAAASAVVLLAGFVPAAQAVSSCSAFGNVVARPDGTYRYCVTVWWRFGSPTAPEQINLLLPHVEGYDGYDPSDPEHATLIPGLGTSSVAKACSDTLGQPALEIFWRGEVGTYEPDCQVRSLHIAYRNDGPTMFCDALSQGAAILSFDARGTPLPETTYVNGVVIRAADYCATCDYTGPLPELEPVSGVSEMRWGTLKALYR